VTDEHASVYEHCLRALRRACTTGAHGLPLIGIGDWNDGMNRVGVEGRGESVWLAWFLIATLRAFAPTPARGDDRVAADFRARADATRRRWRRTGGTANGTAAPTSTTARRSAPATATSAASTPSPRAGASSPAPATRRARTQAMRSLEEHLVRDDARLLMLLTPPFDRTPHDPGYIKGYLPGVRENGAQYTHAALWAVLATALRGDGDRAFELFQMLNPLTHTARRRRRHATRWSRTWSPPTSTRRPASSAAAAGPGTPARRAGCTGWVGLEAILGFTGAATRSASSPASPPLAGVLHRVPLRRGMRLRDHRARDHGPARFLADVFWAAVRRWATASSAASSGRCRWVTSARCA
jgi:cyclic beta-1,2-glucan synthetase